MGKPLVREPAGHLRQCSAHKTIAGRIDRQFLEPAGYLSPAEQVARDGLQDVNAAADPLQDILTTAIAEAQVAAETALGRMTQQASHQRLEVRRVLDFGIKTIAEQIGSASCRERVCQYV